jgi:hypothetical protein
MGRFSRQREAHPELSLTAGLRTDDLCVRSVRPRAASQRPSRQICASRHHPLSAPFRRRSWRMRLVSTNNVMKAPKINPYAIELSKINTTNAATLAP